MDYMLVGKLTRNKYFLKRLVTNFWKILTTVSSKITFQPIQKRVFISILTDFYRLTEKPIHIHYYLESNKRQILERTIS